MLPPSWKSEFQETVKETQDETDKRQKAENEKNSTNIAAAIQRFAHAYNARHDKPQRKDKFKRTIDIATVLLFATALFTALAGYFSQSAAHLRKPIGGNAKSL